MLPTRARSDDWGDDDYQRTDCTSAVPGPHGEVPWDACNSNYNFSPELSPAIATAAIFGVLTLVHLVEALWYRKVSESDSFHLNSLPYQLFQASIDVAYDRLLTAL